VTVQLGQHAECTANNTAQPAKLTLLKTVTNGFGGTAVPGDWTLTATPPTPGTPLSGPTGDPAVTGAQITPGVGYTLTEAGPTGYAASGPTCVLTGTTTPVPLEGNILTAAIGEDVTCTFVNVQVSPPPTTGPPTPPPTPGPPHLPTTGAPVGLMIGTGAGTVALGVFLVLAARRRRTE
jgi:hypothetical protein